jgi:hypothetical protein
LDRKLGGGEMGNHVSFGIVIEMMQLYGVLQPGQWVATIAERHIGQIQKGREVTDRNLHNIQPQPETITPTLLAGSRR